MHSHLVTVEVGVEGRTYEGMKLDRLTFDKDGLKCLDTESVKCRSTVQHNGMLMNNILEHVPNLTIETLDHLLCLSDVVCYLSLNKLFHNEGLEKLDCHLLGETALVDLKFGSNDDNRTTRVVNTLSEEVLTETSLLSFEHVGK